MELLKAFGVDYKIFIAQLMNFAILFFVLYRFGYKPIFKFLENRKNKIQEGVEMAEEAKIKLEKAQEEKRAIIIEAKKEATKIMAKADELAQKKNEEVIEKIKKEVALIAAKEKDAIKTEREQILKEVKNEAADLIAFALEKILEEKVGTEKDKELIKKAM